MPENADSDLRIQLVSIDSVLPDPQQPRKSFDDEALAELADDIEHNGILLPLLVVALPDGRYRIISGERRWRAAQLADLAMVPVLVKAGLSDEDIRFIALSENIQRKALDLLEEAQAFQALKDQGLSWREIAKRIHKSTAYVLRRVRLLEITDRRVLEEYLSGKRNLQDLVKSSPELDRVVSFTSGGPPTGSRRGRPPLATKPTKPLRQFHQLVREIEIRKLNAQERTQLQDDLDLLLSDLHLLQEKLRAPSDLG